MEADSEGSELCEMLMLIQGKAACWVGATASCKNDEECTAARWAASAAAFNSGRRGLIVEESDESMTHISRSCSETINKS